MKNKIFVILLSLFLLLPISVFAAENGTQNLSEALQSAEQTLTARQPNEETEISSNDVQPNSTLENIQPKVSSPYKTPISKRKIIKKFLFAMFGVTISSLILYFGLTIYNKMRSNVLNKVKTPEGETPLESPCDLESAVKSFLDKTQW